MINFDKNTRLTTLLITLFAFTFISDISAAESKWIAIGDLHNWYSEQGFEIEVGRTGQVRDQQDGLRWPAQYSFQDVQAAKGLWIGSTNYADPVAGKTFDYKVAHIGPRGPVDSKAEIMTQKFKMYAKYDHPNVSVDGEPASTLEFMDLVDSVDVNMLPDRRILNVVNTSMGITMTRNIIGFSNQNHNNYHITDYVFENTGIYNEAGDSFSKTLTGVYFMFQYRYAASREGGPYGSGGYWLPQNTAWGRNTVNEVLGEYPADGEIRAQYSWHGLHSQAADGHDNIGAPYYGEGGDGHLSAQHFMGIVTLHADKSTTDHTDDLSQPSTTWYIGSDDPITYNNDQYNPSKMQGRYAHMMLGHPAKSQAEEIGYTATDWKFASTADNWGNDPGGYSQAQAFGPYDIAPGQKIHIVLAEGVSGLSREMCYEVGGNWYDATVALGGLSNPDGSTPASKDEYKNNWVFTGEDSLLRTFNRAIDAFEADYAIPTPPPPPDKFEVISGGDQIKLVWSNSAEDFPGFAGYKVFRAIHQPDTTYEEIFSCDLSNLTNEFADVKAKRGFEYYYYIVSYDDGNSNQVDLGAPLYSSKFYTMTSKGAKLKRPPGKSLDDIRIVPNPFNIKASGGELQFGPGNPDRLYFYDVPPVCTIRIYTERGDLIYTIEHTDNSGDESWDSITEYRQLIVSGIYIAHFETPEGESTFRKFIVIR
ncbi:MAG: hypothetical protein K9N35_11140 [Candidatus Marinimicrobia bacterium]|nr:hypothetical protein [Candidatus Neomarinimicrobiota bacterium]